MAKTQNWENLCDQGHNQRGSPRKKISKLITVFSDITLEKKLRIKLWHQAYIDEVTELENARGLSTKLNELLEDNSNIKIEFSLLVIEMDGFSYIEELLGKNIGKDLINTIADRIKNIYDKDSVISRFKNDYFAILLIEKITKNKIITLANETISKLSIPYQCKNEIVYLAPNIGIIQNPIGKVSPETIIKQAEFAMQKAKKKGPTKS